MAASCAVGSTHSPARPGIGCTYWSGMATEPQEQNPSRAAEETEQGRDDAVLTNPHDPHDLVEKCVYALEMSPDEAEARLRGLFDVVQHNDVHRWGQDFLDSVEESCAARTAALSETPQPALVQAR